MGGLERAAEEAVEIFDEENQRKLDSEIGLHILPPASTGFRACGTRKRNGSKQPIAALWRGDLLHGKLH
jgi:hypothetical protein